MSREMPRIHLVNATQQRIAAKIHFNFLSQSVVVTLVDEIPDEMFALDAGATATLSVDYRANKVTKEG